MGIAGFASRMRSHGLVNVIGRKGELRKDHAIVDGPSLAHALLQSSSMPTADQERSIAPLFSYSTLGKAAIAWLDTLQEHGFMT